MGAVFPVAHVPRGEAAAQSPTNGPLPRDRKLLGVGSQSRHHGRQASGGSSWDAQREPRSSSPLWGWVFELGEWTLQQRQTGGPSSPGGRSALAIPRGLAGRREGVERSTLRAPFASPPAPARTALRWVQAAPQPRFPSGSAGGSPGGLQGRAGPDGQDRRRGCETGVSFAFPFVLSNRRRHSARERSARLPGRSGFRPRAHRPGAQHLPGSAQRLRHVALTRDSPAAPADAPTNRFARWRGRSRGVVPRPRNPLAMQSPPDWPPTSGTLRPSPFPHPALHALHRLARALLFPAYWALDQLLGCGAPLARANRRRALRAAAGAVGALLLLLLAGLPLALPGLLLWLPLQAWRRPFCYRPPPECWAPPAPWRPSAEPARCFGFLSANLCLLPDGLARFNNLRHSQRRAEAMGAVLLAGLRPSRYGTTGCSPPGPGTPGGSLIAAVPAGLDFVCLQEVFDLRAAHRLVGRLAPYLGPVLYDVGSFGLQPGPHLKLLGSGLLLASRYPLLRAAFRCFPHARREDALASKGLLSAQV